MTMMKQRSQRGRPQPQSPPQQALARALQYHQAGRLADAEAIYRQVLAAEPANPTALHLLGVMANQVKQPAASVDLISRAIQVDPTVASYHSNLGVAYQALGQREQALACYSRALSLKPDHVDALNNQGVVLQELGQAQAALDSFERSLKLRPNHAETLTNAGVSLRILGRLAEAETRFRRALKVQPTFMEALTNLASTLQDAGRLTDSVTAFRRALDVDPTSAKAHSGLIFVLDLLPDGLAQAQDERQRFNARFGQRWRTEPPTHLNLPDPDRRLRVGYVSADFYHHSAALAIMPILRSHDHAQVEVVCYSGVTAADALTAEAQSLADGWRDITQLSDDQLFQQIQADQIDILVDLSGHSAGNRLPVFGRKPAPVQVTAWGYAAGTGVAAIDAFLADAVVIPTDRRQEYAEEIIDLPSVLCLESPYGAPPVGPAPSATTGVVTFGSFHRLPRLTADVLDLWARVVAAVPGARMLLKASGLDEPAARERITSAFAQRGVAADRLTIIGGTSRQEHLAAYSQVDIQLDTFPQSGGVTTFEGLLMGVPSVTLLGEGVTGRISASFLTTLGLTELIATTPDEYVAAATRAAGDLTHLAVQRAGLRQRLLDSPIGNGPLYTRAVEDAYRTLWRRWCVTRQSESAGPVNP